MIKNTHNFIFVNEITVNTSLRSNEVALKYRVDSVLDF